MLSIYGLLIGSAFLSATLLPGSSEAILIGLLAGGQGQPALLVMAATLGNVAGAMVNWVLGRFFSQYEGRSWFPLSRRTTKTAEHWFQRYGVWSLLFSWVPVVGDPLTFVAGLLRVNIWRFLVLVSIGKALRYVAIVAAWLQLTGE